MSHPMPQNPPQPSSPLNWLPAERVAPLEVAYRGPFTQYDKLPFVYLSAEWAVYLQLERPKQSYWESSIVLAESRSQLKSTKTMNTDRRAALEVMAEQSKTSIHRALEHYTMRPGFQLGRVENIGQERFLRAVLLNGKMCEVKLPEQEAKRGIWFCTYELCALIVDPKEAEAKGLDSTEDQYHVVKLDCDDLESLEYWVKEIK